MSWTKRTYQSEKLLTVHVKFHQICTLIGLFCWKYIKLQLKMYRGFMSHVTEEWCKIWRKTGLCFRKWDEEFSKSLPEHLKVSRLWLWWGPYIHGGKCMSLKFTDELCVMTTKNDAKFEEELTCNFKIDMRNLTNFDPSIRKSRTYCTLIYNVWGNKTRKSYVWWLWGLMQNLKENWLMLSKMRWEIWQIFTGWKILISY